MDVWKVDEFIFLNEEVEEFLLATSSKKPLNIVYEA